MVSASIARRRKQKPGQRELARPQLVLSGHEHDGDFAGVGILLADATFTRGAGSVSGRDAIEKMLRDSLIVYDDGSPRTKHVTTNVAIEVDEEAGTAVSRSYFTALQALPDLALPSLAVATKTASSAATSSGASWRGASEPISSAT